MATEEENRGRIRSGQGYSSKEAVSRGILRRSPGRLFSTGDIDAGFGAKRDGERVGRSPVNIGDCPHGERRSHPIVKYRGFRKRGLVTVYFEGDVFCNKRRREKSLVHPGYR